MMFAVATAAMTMFFLLFMGMVSLPVAETCPGGPEFGDVVLLQSGLDVTRADAFAAWKAEHGKSYATKAEDLHRQQIFESNLKQIEAHNQQARKQQAHNQQAKKQHFLGMNQFGDLTPVEFKSKLFRKSASLNLVASKHSPNALSADLAPNSVDWRTLGYVTPVKDSGACNSSWAFAAVGALEGQHFKKAGVLVSLSAQNLVDCSSKHGNQGCDGGTAEQSFAYVKSNRGLDTETSYPYKSRYQKCNFKAANVGATCSGHTAVTSGSESDLMDAVATVGPIAATIDGSHDSFRFYKSGIYYEPACKSDPAQELHSVLIVGYGVDADQNSYWLVKNSWGAEWGNKGYIMMAKDRDNNCGIADGASYPVV